MADVTNGQNVILNIIQRIPGVTVGEVMKVAFMLQEALGVEAGYDFTLNSSGVYASGVEDDIGELRRKWFLSWEFLRKDSSVVYSLSLTSDGDSALCPFEEKELRDLDRVVRFFAGKSGRELELETVIVYVKTLHIRLSLASDDMAVLDAVRAS